MNLVYIICPGHSGSTLLDMLLGMHDEIFSTGELIHLPNQYLNSRLYEPSPLNGFQCSCGSGFNECEFWGEILKRIDESYNTDLRNKPLNFKTGFLFNHSRPHLTKQIRIFRRIYKTILNSNLKSLDNILKNRYNPIIRNNEILMSEVGKLSQSKYIVDSSKDYFRLHFLLYSQIKVKVIVLKRSIFGVASSAKKLKNNSDPIRAAHSWIHFYKQLDNMLSFHNINPLNVSYENLIKQPHKELEKIFLWLGLKNEKLPSEIKFYPPHYHIVAGNGLRQKDEIVLRNRDNWKSILSASEVEKINQLIR